MTSLLIGMLVVLLVSGVVIYVVAAPHVRPREAAADPVPAPPRPPRQLGSPVATPASGLSETIHR